MMMLKKIPFLFLIHKDCSDNSDEENCSYNCTGDEFSCTGPVAHWPHRGVCIHRGKVWIYHGYFHFNLHTS